MNNSDFTTQVRTLEALSERDFASVVYRWIRNPDRTPEETALMRDPDLIVRTLEAIETLIATTTSGIEKMSHSSDPDAPSKVRFRKDLLRRLEVERRAIKSAAREEAEQRAQLRRGKGPRHRAMVRLSKEPDLQERFLRMVREEQAKDAARDRIE